MEKRGQRAVHNILDLVRAAYLREHDALRRHVAGIVKFHVRACSTHQQITENAIPYLDRQVLQCDFNRFAISRRMLIGMTDDVLQCLAKIIVLLADLSEERLKVLSWNILKRRALAITLK